MATLNTQYIYSGNPDGTEYGSVVRSRLFAQSVTVDNYVNPGDTLATSTNYALCKFPKNFIPRYAIVNVLKANVTTSTLTVSVAKNVTSLTDATITAVNGTSSTAALATAGQTLIAFATASSAGTAPWLTGENDYLVASVATNAADAQFEVVVVGDWATLAK